IFFQASHTGVEEMDIFTPANSTTNSFVFNGGSVGDTKDDSASTDTGLVTTVSGSQMSFGMNFGNVYWGANIMNASGGEVKFLSGGSGMVQWLTLSTLPPAAITNLGTWDFVASDSSNSNSGIAVSQANVNGSDFDNLGQVNFRNSTGNYHEDLPFLNGGNLSSGTLNIYDNVTVILPNYYSDATYGNTVLYQGTASGNQVNIFCGQINIGGAYVQQGGTLQYGNQSGKTNHCQIASIGASPFGVYGEGGYFLGDVTLGATILDLTQVTLVLGNDSGSNVQMQFDCNTTGAGTFSRINCLNLTLNATNIVMNLHDVAGTTAPSGHGSQTLLGYSNTFAGSGSFVASDDGTWHSWTNQGGWSGSSWRIAW